MTSVPEGAEGPPPSPPVRRRLPRARPPQSRSAPSPSAPSPSAPSPSARPGPAGSSPVRSDPARSDPSRSRPAERHRARSHPVPAWAGLLLGLGVPVPAALGWLLFVRWTAAGQGARDIRLQLAGSRTAAAAVVADRTAEFRASLDADLWLVCGYALTLAAAGLLGGYVFTRPHWRLVALAAGLAGVLAGACDLVEDLLLDAGLGGTGPGTAGGDAPFAAAAAFAIVKWLLLLPAGTVGTVVCSATVHRAVRGVLRRPPEETARASTDGAPEGGPEGELGGGPADGPEGAPGGGPDAPPDGGPELIPPWPVATARGGRWPPGPRSQGPPTRQARWHNAARVPPGREHARLGFCVSGGGIRSACVTLGALQSLRPWLKQARYLVSVSGGGYTVGAMQLALTDSAPGCPVRARSGLTPDTVLEPGSPEEDHLRRHAKYLADGAGEWLVALGTLLRGLVAALGLLGATVLVLGLGLSRFYHLVPLTDLSHLAPVGLHTGGTGAEVTGTAGPGAAGPGTGLGPPAVRAPALLALAGLLTAAALGWLLWLLTFSWLGWNSLLPRVLRRFSQAALALAALLALGVLAVPGLAWGAVRLQQALAVGARQTGAGISLTVLLSYLALLLGILWHGRHAVEQGAAVLGGLVRGTRRLGGGLTGRIAEYLVLWSALAALTAGALLTLGWAVATGHAWPTAAQVLLPLVLGTVGLNLDQTWMGLHPFYRRRLASAFAVRRAVERDGAATDAAGPGAHPGTATDASGGATGDGGEVLARPYHFFGEQTRLSHYGARHPGFPQVIFAAAANLSGNARTPPGRRAVSFTFSSDYVGGPDVGYARTDLLERRTRRHIARDLTVQSAMAVSGAAFSSAMGRQARGYQGLFAITNARLGTWLPNPAALAPLWAADRDWRYAPQPAVRRLPYQLREACGRYPMDARFLLTTDGGHYENLGLVELLRHGVRTAVCIDASGDSAFAATLAAAITLAREELGIAITLREPDLLIPGSAGGGGGARGGPSPEGGGQPPLRGLAARLADRLSARAVVVGDIEYPWPLDLDDLEDGGAEAAGGDDRAVAARRGTLIVAQAVLTPDMPYELHAYAVADAAFPNDSTSDQWFDHRQFDAYQTLGRYLGEQAGPAVKAAVLGTRTPPGSRSGAGPDRTSTTPPDGAGDGTGAGGGTGGGRGPEPRPAPPSAPVPGPAPVPEAEVADGAPTASPAPPEQGRGARP
ncbi:hypothetical protein [Kitasatospora sp. NBC_00458]|uniref:hypothetical protein n=1 Tax=Kitasatospora sp. NBC_00458 TaxID=2903568 RepID=UPI002E1822D6